MGYYLSTVLAFNSTVLAFNSHHYNNNKSKIDEHVDINNKLNNNNNSNQKIIKK